jgi:hypothetical protein
MHTRRVGAFLIGAWLLGALLTAFLTSQSYANVDRFFSNPPLQVSKEIDDIGPDVMRQILRFQASQYNRHISETWEVMQLGILAALLATSFLTSHRSRIVIISTAAMFVMVLIAYLSLTPTMNSLARSYDFLPPGAAMQDRDNYSFYAVWYRVMDVLKAILALLIAGRLLFDRYDWQEKLAPESGSTKNLKRRRRSHSSSRSSSSPTAAASGQAASEESELPTSRTEGD